MTKLSLASVLIEKRARSYNAGGWTIARLAQRIPIEHRRIGDHPAGYADWEAEWARKKKT